MAQTYERRRPETTLLHRIVREHLLTLLAFAKEDGGEGLPRYVEQEFRKYVKCGVLACGFARARCKSCGADILVAFSCKRRGICPSCGARKMANTAAHLVEHVLPDVPLRQWVLSVPFDLQFLLARDPRLLSAVLRIFVDVTSMWHVKQATARGAKGAKAGAVSFVQRFGSTLNLHLHFHILVLDGVYVLGKDGESLVFHPSPTPTTNDIHALTMTVLRRVRTLLKRRGLAGQNDDADESETPPEVRDVAPGIFADVDDTGCILPSSPVSKRRRDGAAPSDETCGFSLDASVRIAAGDFQGRERLCRYGARHPFSLERLSETADGCIAYKMKKPRQGKRFLVMTPISFLRRLAFLVPPPFYPLLRYHGVLAPNSKWRSRIVRVSTGPKGSGSPHARCAEPTPPAVSEPNPHAEISSRPAATVAPPAASGSVTSSSETFATLASTLLAATTSRLSRFEWATLLKRIYDVDALACPSCDGRLEFIAVLTEPTPIRAILDHLGISAAPPVLARARDPTFTAFSQTFDAHP